MKKSKMRVAVASALLVGGPAAFGDMHVNSQGTGEALIYPFYSAANENDTFVHIVNTTEYTKAVKVRFIEAQNSQEVLDFNLYLSPNDEWAGAITKNPNGTGAVIRTVDNSCTVPELGTAGGANVGQLAGTKTVLPNGKILRDQPFVDFKYRVGIDTDKTLARTTEGYVEIIEMGQLDPEFGFGADAVHDANGVPADCAELVKAWSVTKGVQGAWLVDPQTELLPTWMGGGLYGYGVLINVNKGTAVGVDSVAIENFSDQITNLHFQPGFEQPSLADAQPFVTIFDGSNANDYEMENGEHAVSSLFMTTDVMNDYVLDEEINALTDWVITMPTKRFYVNPGDAKPTAPPAKVPFNKRWNGTNACEPVAISQWDREEAFVPPPSDGPVFSPQPPGVESDDFNLCTEVSVISFGGEDSAINASSKIQYGFTPDYANGWAKINFLPESLNDPEALQPGARELESLDGDVFNGLPVVGFAAFVYQNGTLEGGSVLSNYAAASVHKTATEVTSND